MTWIELVRMFFPGKTDQECNDILWSKTCFPVGGIRYVYPQLQHYSRIAKYGVPTCDWCNNFCRGTCCDTCERGINQDVD